MALHEVGAFTRLAASPALHVPNGVRVKTWGQISMIAWRRAAVSGWASAVCAGQAAPASMHTSHSHPNAWWHLLLAGVLQVCDATVLELPLVDAVHGTRHGAAHVFKDYSDVLHVTVVLGAEQHHAGQLLHYEPVSPLEPGAARRIRAGSVSLWTDLAAVQAGDTPYWDQMVGRSDSTAHAAQGGFKRWSCFTYRVNMKKVGWGARRRAMCWEGEG